MPSSDVKNSRSTLTTRRKLQILHAALGIGAKRGLAAMTMDEVAYAAKLSKGLPFYYFKSKQKLHLAMIDLFTEGIVDRAAKILNTEQANETSLRSLAWEYVSALTVACKHPQITLEFWSMALRDREVAQRLGRIREQMTAWFADLLNHGVGAGEFACPDSEIAARSLYATCMGIVSQWVLSKKAFDPRPVLEYTFAGILNDRALSGGTP